MPRVDDYRAALELARRELKELDPKQVARNAGGQFLPEDDGSVQLPFLDKTLLVRFGEMNVTRLENDGIGELPIQEQILVLHYLLGATGSPPTGRLITYREIPSGEFYYSAFKKRAIDPLVRTFGANGPALERSARILGGIRRPELAGLAFWFTPFPGTPITLQVQEADDEFPANGNVFFDEVVAETLSLEDVAWLAGMLVYRLMAVAREAA